MKKNSEKGPSLLMKGIELSKKYYLEFGASMIHEQFSEIESLIAVGLVGAGSECFGFDDDLSHDHDFEPGFCMFIPDEDVIDSRTEFRLERAYSKLPREFCGFRRQQLSPVGGNRHGVIRTSDFYKAKTGNKSGKLNFADWLTISETYLAEATNGEIFRDDYGEFSLIRNNLLNMPDDIVFKKLAGNLLLMGQSGYYNYDRCLAHGETAAAQLAIGEYVSNCMSAVFHLNRKYMPFYKWSFRALSQLEKLGQIAPSLEILLTTGNTSQLAETKKKLIDKISFLIVEELKKQQLTQSDGNDLGVHAYSVNEKVSDISIRNAHILSAV